MKKFYTVLILFSLFSFQAQTITQSFNEPIVGDVDKSTRLDTSLYTTGLPTNVTGNNCSWDFTKFTGVFPMVIDSFISPSSVPNASAHPNATYVQNRDKIYTFYKSSTSPSRTELLGGYTTSLTLTFTNTAIIASYPINYGYSQTDPVSGTFLYNTTNGICNGSITVTADGMGTVNLPNGVSIPNVLRLKSVEVLTLLSFLGSVPIPVGSFNQTIYNYYMPGKKFPIVNIGYTTYQLLAGTPTITALVYGSQNYFSIVGQKENIMQNFDLLAYPNPFHSELNFQSIIESSVFSFYNLNGQMILQTQGTSANELEKLQAGIYFLEIKNRQGVHRQKVIKE